MGIIIDKVNKNTKKDDVSVYYIILTEYEFSYFSKFINLVFVKNIENPRTEIKRMKTKSCVKYFLNTFFI